MTIRILAGLGGLALLAFIIRAAGLADILQSFAAISADPWGLVTLVDLYLGFLLISVVIWHLEARAAIALCWIIPLFVLGNLVSALWLAVSGVRFLRASNRPDRRPA